MKRSLLIVVMATVLLATPFAQGGTAADETRATLRQYVLELVNRDRHLHGLPPVELDVNVSEIGDVYCRAQIANRTTGHFTTDGLTPYMRYSFAGGNDAVSENAAAWSADYRFSARALYEMVRRSQETMMAEKPPEDGHRRTILDPHATHVGIGLAWEGGEFRFVQEFVRRHIEWSAALPRNASLTDRVVMRGRARRGTRIDAITVHFEPVPAPMTARVANAIERYALPKNREEYRPRLSPAPTASPSLAGITPRRYSDGTFGSFGVNGDGAFAFTVPFNRGAGIYTVVVWLSEKGDAEAFTASTTSIRVAESRTTSSAAGAR